MSRLVDPRGPEWKNISKLATGRLEEKRVALENEKDPVEAAELRGDIAALRWLLSLADEEKQVHVRTDDYAPRT